MLRSLTNNMRYTVGLTKKITNKSNIIFKEFKDIPESKIIPMDKKENSKCFNNTASMHS